MQEQHLEREDQDVEVEHLEEEGQQHLPNSHYLNPSERNILNFLRIPKAKKTARGIQKVELLVDYLQSQKLTLDHDLLALQSIVAKKQALQQLKLDKQREKEEKRQKNRGKGGQQN